MIQGSESALKVFIEEFEEIKTLALSDNDEDDDPTQANNKDPNTDTSPGKSDQKIAMTPKTITSVSRMKDSFSLLEVEVVELKEFIISHLSNNNMEQLTNDILNLRQEIKYLQSDREEMSLELQQTKDEVREIKSTLGKQLKEVRAEMQEELSALKSTLHTKDKLINSLKNSILFQHVKRLLLNQRSS